MYSHHPSPLGSIPGSEIVSPFQGADRMPKSQYHTPIVIPPPPSYAASFPPPLFRGRCWGVVRWFFTRAQTCHSWSSRGGGSTFIQNHNSVPHVAVHKVNPEVGASHIYVTVDACLTLKLFKLIPEAINIFFNITINIKCIDIFMNLSKVS